MLEFDRIRHLRNIYEEMLFHRAHFIGIEEEEPNVFLVKFKYCTIDNPIDDAEREYFTHRWDYVLRPKRR